MWPWALLMWSWALLMWSLVLLMWSWALIMWCLTFQKLEIQTHKLSGSGIMISTATASVISILHTASCCILFYSAPFWNVCQYPRDFWGNGAAHKHVQYWVSLQNVVSRHWATEHLPAPFSAPQDLIKSTANDIAIISILVHALHNTLIYVHTHNQQAVKSGHLPTSWTCS